MTSAASSTAGSAMSGAPRPRVGLFVTCLVDLYRPSVGFAAVKLLEAAGCTVEVPPQQTCCGQPAYNSGDRATAIELVKAVVAAFEPYDYVVLPSGSCGGMLKSHAPTLLKDDGAWGSRANTVAAKTFELISFLVDVRGLIDASAVSGTYNGRVTYHDSCSGLRELGIKDQPRTLLKSVKGLQLVEMPDSEVCCGFGGTFAVKFGDVSNAMVSKKVANANLPKPDLLLAGDLGCLLNMAGKLKRQGSAIKARHVAEVLAGEMTDPAIGEST